MNDVIQPASYRAHVKATLVLGLPLIGSLIAQMAVGLTDTVMVGWYGIEELAAVVLGTSIYFVFFIVGSGFAMAVMPMVASAEGEGNKKQVRRHVRMGLWITLMFCVAVTPILWNFEALLLLLGQEPGVSALAAEYMQIAMWGLFPAMLIMVLKSYLSALERPNWVLWGTIIGAVANALLNYAFIFGNWGAPELGVKGAAIASVGTGTITFIVLVLYSWLQRDLREYAIFDRFWVSDWSAFAEVFRMGWPIGATMFAEVGLFTASAVMMGWVGTTELATHGIVLQIASMSFMVYLGLANVATIRVGRALGRNDVTGIRRASTVVLCLQIGTAFFVILGFVLAPEFLIGLFLDASNPKRPEILAYGVGLMLAAAAFQIVDGLQVVALSVLRGLKDTRIPMICAVFSYWIVGVPVAYWLAFVQGYGGYGLWYGLALGLAAAAVTMGARIYWLFRKMA